MCLVHNLDLKKEWLPKKPFIAYKIIFKSDNRSANYSFKWTVGTHKQPAEKLNPFGETGKGFYAYLDKAATAVALSACFKVIAVHIDPKDVVYAGMQWTPRGDKRAVVCRKLTIKSLRKLKLSCA